MRQHIERPVWAGMRRMFCLGCVLALAFGLAPGLTSVVGAVGCVVSTTGDSGTGSLRQAITDANGGACASPITFAIGMGAQTINVATTLPALTTNVTVDGSTQPGYSGTPLITLNRTGNPVTFFTVNTGVTVRIAALMMQGATTGAITSAGTLTVADCVLQNNLKDQSGGGVLNNGGTLTVTGSTLRGNQSFNGEGGAIATVSGTTTVRTSVITGNLAQSGSGLSLFGGTLIVDRSAITANTGGGNIGGGIYIHVNAVTTTLYVTNSTISGNNAGVGGGVYADVSTNVIFTNATVSGNTTTTGPGPNGGGVWFAGASGTFANTIIANNTVASGGTGPDVYFQVVSGAITDQGHNLIGKTDGSPAGTFNDPTDYLGTIAVPRDPGIAPLPLANNGGPTPTDALFGNSVAVDHGNTTICTNTSGIAPVGNVDQRGVRRPQGLACDIGAFEYFALTLTGGTLPTSGGIATLTGNGFQPGLTLTIDGAPVTVIAVSTDGTGLTARVPAHAPGIVSATVSEAFAPAPATANVTYAAFTPIVSALGPTSGDIRGGSLVTLTGSYFASDASVSVDNMPVATFTVVDDMHITFLTPAHGIGSATVRVTVEGLTGTSPTNYTYGIVNATPAPKAMGVPATVPPATAAPTHAPGSATAVWARQRPCLSRCGTKSS